MRTEEIKIYKFEELDESAKETARNRWRNGGLDYDWWDSVYEDFLEICKILGIETTYRQISFSCGAHFEGYYQYKKGSLKKIKDYAPQDKELHEIARNLYLIQKRYFYSLYATVSSFGRYHSMSIDVCDRSDNYQYVLEGDADALAETLRDLANWLYSRLEAEYEYLNSDSVIDEDMIRNDCEFYENGEIY